MMLQRRGPVSLCCPAERGSPHKTQPCSPPGHMGEPHVPRLCFAAPAALTAAGMSNQNGSRSIVFVLHDAKAFVVPV